VSAEKIVLAAHGSRSPEANASVVELARTLGERLDARVFAAFLEMAEPTILEAMRMAASHQARRIVVVPFFLAPGMHVRRDLLRIVEQSRRELGVPIVVAEFFGSHAQIPELLFDITRAALGHAGGAGGPLRGPDDLRTRQE